MKRSSMVTAIISMIAGMILIGGPSAMAGGGIKKVTIDQVKAYDVPKHFKMVAMRLHGKKETGCQNFWVGMSHFLPGGGAEYGPSPLEKVYFVLKGEVTIKTKTQEIVLGPWDSIYIGADESRGIIDNTNKTATMLVIYPYPKK